MALFKLEWKPSAQKDFKKIDRQHIFSILRKVETLPKNPYPPDSKKLKNTEGSYRVRIGDYRVIYQIDHRDKVIVIHAVSHRKDAYR